MSDAQQRAESPPVGDEVWNDAIARQSPLEVQAAYVQQITHDVRSPLNSIAIWGELLTRSDSLEMTGEAAETIRRSVRHIVRLTSNLVEMVCLVADGAPSRTEKVDLEELIAECWSEWEPSSGADVRLALDVDPRARHVISDWRRVRGILCALLSHAKHLVLDGATVELRVRRDGALVRGRLLVTTKAPSPNGRGVSPARGGLSSAQLAMANELAGRCGGAARAELDERGPAFAFDLPLPAAV